MPLRRGGCVCCGQTVARARYALRRVDNVRASNEVAAGAVELWRRVPHPSVIPLRNAFVQNAGARARAAAAWPRL